MGVGVGGQFHASTAVTPGFIQHCTDTPTPYAVITFREVRRKSSFAQVGIVCVCVCVYIYIYIQGVTGGTDQTSGECSLGQTIPI